MAVPPERRPGGDAPSRIARVVLIGFMAAGKSTTGRALADLLGWRFVDFDDEIERRTGRTVPEIFEQDGEERFRALEAALTEELGTVAGAVLAPGGGWITQPEVLRQLGPDSLVVWLRISPEEAARRAARGPNHRPLLAGPDPLGLARELIAQREPLYRLADVAIDVDGREPTDIAAQIADLAAARGA
jgi:shikimate kinase